MSYGRILNSEMLHLFDPGTGPIYGLSANVAQPPLAAMLSVAMILGVDWLGLTALRWLQLGHFDRWPWLRWQALPIGAALLAVVLFPVALLGGLPRVVLQPLAISMVIAGLAHGWRSLVKRDQGSRWPRAMRPFAGAARMNAMDILFWLTVAGLGLLALGPVTDVDALDYHVGVALSILNTGAFPFAPEWFTSRLAGSGEVLVALGLAIGGEQFGSLLQYSGVLGIVGIFRYGFASADPGCSSQMRSWRQIVALAVISTPVFLAWVASPKPMLLPVAMTTAALMAAVSIIAAEKDKLALAQQRNAFALVCLLVMEAAVSKMNFLLSGAVVGSIALAYMIRNRQTVSALVIGFTSGLLILAPPVVWKHAYFGGAMIDALLTPFPGHWPGTTEFEAMLRVYRDTNVAFPLSLLVPSGMGTLTTVLGLGLFLPAIALSSPKVRVTYTLIIAACVVAVLGATLGQRNARFFLEPYLWLLMAALLVGMPSGGATKWTSVAVAVQSVLVLAMMGVGIATLTPGALSTAFREKTMERHASGYAAMKWAGSVLPHDARLIVVPRSIALAPVLSIANDWRGHVPLVNGGERIYLDAVAKKKPNFMLVHTPAGERPTVESSGMEIAMGPFHFTDATRNPFNSGMQRDAWILRVESDQRTDTRK